MAGNRSRAHRLDASGDARSNGRLSAYARTHLTGNYPRICAINGPLISRGSLILRARDYSSLASNRLFPSVRRFVLFKRHYDKYVALSAKYEEAKDIAYYLEERYHEVKVRASLLSRSIRSIIRCIAFI